jgi:hypothetical protein
VLVVLAVAGVAVVVVAGVAVAGVAGVVAVVVSSFFFSSAGADIVVNWDDLKRNENSHLFEKRICCVAIVGCAFDFSNFQSTSGFFFFFFFFFRGATFAHLLSRCVNHECVNVDQTDRTD